MTSAIFRSNKFWRNGGFTLTEILVVITIIVVLVGILLPTLIRAYSQADKTKTAATLQVLGMGLEAYKQDFGDYPRFGQDTAGTVALNTSTQRGAILLCRALVGQDAATVDGADGPGFKTRRLPGPDNVLNTSDDTFIGKTYGPYVNTDRLKIMGSAGSYELADPNGVAILYFPTSPARRDLTAANAYVANSSYTVANPICYLNFFDNSDPAAFFTGITFFEAMIGESYGTLNGKIDPGETPINVPYLLYAAGADGKFGPGTVTGATGLADIKACDDVTNVQK